MAPEHTLDVKGRGVEALRDAHHLRGDNEKEDRIGIHEATDQPRTGDTVNLRPAARHPKRPALLVARGDLVGPDQHLACFFPPLKPAFQSFRIDALLSQPCGRALAKLLPLVAHDHNRSALVLRGPLGDRAVVSAQGAGYQTWIGAIVVIYPDVDDRRCVGKTNKS